MSKDQQIELFKKEVMVIEGERDYYKRVVWALMEGERIERRKSEKCSIVLEYFLNWPYQDYFLKKAKLMWKFLPESYYAVLLLMICDKIESKYGEGKSFDYRELLKEFWCQSPDHCKRHVFKNQKVTFRSTNTGQMHTVKSSVGLLIELLALKNFTYKDEEIIKLILDNATVEEKDTILSTEEWTRICIKLMADEKWETLDRRALYFFSSREEESKFKRELCFKAQNVCIDFAVNDNFIAAESFIKWSSLSEEETGELKENMINSRYGLASCRENFIRDKVKEVEKFIRWCLPSEEEAKLLKKKIIFAGTSTCAYFVERDEQDLVNKLIEFCLSSEEEVRELKKTVAYEHGGLICTRLISKNNDVYDHNCDDPSRNEWRIEFNGGKWEEVEKFLTWCFSSEEELSTFKKNKLLKEYGEKIHFELIQCCQWEEAEIFFSWLGLSVEEIKELKKRTLFNYSEASEMFRELFYSEEGDIKFIDYGNNQEAIELLLRWYLTDKEMILECKDKLFKTLHPDIEEENEYKDSDNGEENECSYSNTDVKREVYLKEFDLMIEQRLKDLDFENMGVKRTGETFPPNKRLCISKHETIGAEGDE